MFARFFRSSFFLLSFLVCLFLDAFTSDNAVFRKSFSLMRTHTSKHTNTQGPIAWFGEEKLMWYVYACMSVCLYVRRCVYKCKWKGGRDAPKEKIIERKKAMRISIFNHMQWNVDNLPCMALAKANFFGMEFLFASVKIHLNWRQSIAKIKIKRKKKETKCFLFFRKTNDKSLHNGIYNSLDFD